MIQWDKNSPSDWLACLDRYLHNGVRAVVWDLDNTLVDEREYLLPVFKAFSELTDSPCIAKRLGEIYTRDGNSGLYDKLKISTEARIGTLDAFLHILRNVNIPSGLRLLPGAKLAFEMLINFKVKQGILTNGNPTQQRNKIRLLRINHASIMPAVVYANEITPKPSPEGLHYWCGQLAVDVKQLLFICDSVVDSQCAAAAGCHFLGTPSNWLPGFLDDTGGACSINGYLF